MFDIFEPLNIISFLVFILVVVLVFNPWGSRDILFQYVNIHINFEKIIDDLLEFIKRKIGEGDTTIILSSK